VAYVLAMSQAFAEIRHFRKYLGNSGNAWCFLNSLGISGNVAEIGNKLYFIYCIQNLGNGTTQKN
jgi:hypothetical protein